MDQINKTLAWMLCGTLSLFLTLPVSAQEDYSNEDYWYSTCTKAQTSTDGVKACQGFKEYQNQKKQDLAASIESFNNSISQLEGKSEEIEKLAKEQKELKDRLQEQIAQKEAVIQQYEEQIGAVQGEINARQEEINAWDNQIKTRMRQEQSALGTSMAADILMGATDLNDMLRKITGLQRITEDDQEQIEQLGRLKEQLELQKGELERLEQEQKDQRDELEGEKTQAAQLEESYNQLVAQYEQQIADLQAAKRAAQADMDAIRDFVISSNFTGTLNSVSGATVPVLGGSYSAGTWAYPGGGLHLGLDWATPIGTPVVAPADGIILYASNPAPSNGGYLGNWSGYPYGGGNTIQMICNIDGTTYAFSFFHLSQEGFAVSPGQTVTAGQTIALSGNSGNSTGPHVHLEVINLGNMSVEQAVKQFSSNADFAWGTGWNTTSTACEVKGSAPCRERPEIFFS